MKSLEKDRTRRYETASGLARDIEHYLAGDPVEAGPPSAAYRLRKLARKYRGALTTAAVVAIVLASAMVVSTWQAIRATRAERRAVDEAGRALAAETQARTERDHALNAEAEAISQRNAAVESKKEADKQAAIARTVNDFLQNDLLAEASPEKNACAEKVTVEELVKRAGAKISGKFEKQPEIEAAIRLTIGVALISLGLYSEAQPHLERAVEIRRRVLGSEYRDTIIAQYRLAEAQIEQRKLVEAERVLRQTLDVARRVLGREDRDTLEVWYRLSEVAFYQGKYVECENLSRQLLDIALRAYGPDHPRTLDFQGSLAVAIKMQGKFAEAEALYHKSLESQRRVLGSEHPITLTTQSNLAQLCKDEGKLAEAELLLPDARKQNASARC